MVRLIPQEGAGFRMLINRERCVVLCLFFILCLGLVCLPWIARVPIVVFVFGDWDSASRESQIKGDAVWLARYLPECDYCLKDAISTLKSERGLTIKIEDWILVSSFDKNCIDGSILVANKYKNGERGFVVIRDDLSVELVSELPELNRPRPSD